MDPRDFHSLAKQLATQTAAACCRTAISRAYYAAYNVSVRFLERLYLPIPHDPTSHKLVRKWLTASDDHDMRAISGKLKDLYGDRIKADYLLDDPVPELQQNAQARAAVAESIIETLDRAAGDQGRCNKIAESIRRYENMPRWSA